MKKKTLRIAALALAAIAGFVMSSSSVGAKKPAVSEHDRITQFWTTDKIAKAKPRDYVFDFVKGDFKLTNAREKSVMKPLGTTWSTQGDVVHTTGKVYFTMGKAYYTCTGTVIDDTASDRSIVLTAAHCAYDDLYTHAYATNWMFVPDFSSSFTKLNGKGEFCQKTSKGCWTAEHFLIPYDYADRADYDEDAVLHDYAFITVGLGGKSNAHLDATVGGNPIVFTTKTVGTATSAFGYPGALKFSGKALKYCQGALALDRYNGYESYKVPCQLSGASAGGPWFASFANNGSDAVFSLNSYRYLGLKAMHGPIFGAETEATYNAALTATSNAMVRHPS